MPLLKKGLHYYFFPDKIRNKIFVRIQEQIRAKGQKLLGKIFPIIFKMLKEIIERYNGLRCCGMDKIDLKWIILMLEEDSTQGT
jgi:hypothetical protein